MNAAHSPLAADDDVVAVVTGGDAYGYVVVADDWSHHCVLSDLVGRAYWAQGPPHAPGCPVVWVVM